MQKRNLPMILAGLAFAAMVVGLGYSMLSGEPRVWGIQSTIDDPFEVIRQKALKDAFPAKVLSTSTRALHIPFHVKLHGIKLRFKQHPWLKPEERSGFFVFLVDPVVPYGGDEICALAGKEKLAGISNPPAELVKLQIAYCMNEKALVLGQGEVKPGKLDKLIPAIILQMFDKPISENRK